MILTVELQICEFIEASFSRCYGFCMTLTVELQVCEFIENFFAVVMGYA